MKFSINVYASLTILSICTGLAASSSELLREHFILDTEAVDDADAALFESNIFNLRQLGQAVSNPAKEAEPTFVVISSTEDAYGAVDTYLCGTDDKKEAIQLLYGPFSEWRFADISLASLFDGIDRDADCPGEDYRDFNDDISGWDTGSVTNMERMFASAFEFNQDISAWDVSNVKDMMSMFENTFEFNQDISAWDVSNVEDMLSMFEDAEKFNQDISAWDVSNVEDMRFMFSYAERFNQNLCAWGPHMSAGGFPGVSSMFNDSGCDEKGDPSNGATVSPLCFSCI